MPDVEVLYLSSVSSPAELARMQAHRRPGVEAVTYGMIESSHKFHWLIQAGLVDAADDVRIRAVTGRPLTPAFYEGRWWRRRVERCTPHLTVDHVAVPNLPVAKQLWVAATVALRAAQWRARTAGAPLRILVADASYITALPGVLAALAGSDVRRTAIFADLYSYMGEVKDARESRPLPQRLAAAAIKRVYRHLDGFILLTEQMDAVVNPQGKPHMVMEGLADTAMNERTNDIAAKDTTRTVLYAGALRREYGLGDLVEGFELLDDPEARLVIYGSGEYVADLQAAAARDSRIDYRGTAPIADVVAAEEKAWLLVNPRPADKEFTQYSFPSKNMEYLASGTAVMTTPLPGMPAEYRDHVLLLEGTGPEAVRDALAGALAQGLPALHERGARGKEFVLTQKNNRAQARRIVEFVRSLRGNA